MTALVIVLPHTVLQILLGVMLVLLIVSSAYSIANQRRLRRLMIEEEQAHKSPPTGSA